MANAEQLADKIISRLFSDPDGNQVDWLYGYDAQGYRIGGCPREAAKEAIVEILNEADHA